MNKQSLLVIRYTLKVHTNTFKKYYLTMDYFPTVANGFLWIYTTQCYSIPNFNIGSRRQPITLLVWPGPQRL